MAAQPWVFAAGVLLLIGVLASKTSSRFGVPSLLLFLALGMLAGSDGIGGIEFDDFELSRSFGIVALAFILFSGGLGTPFPAIRPVLRTGTALASVGVVLTAALLGWAASLILDLPLEEGLLLGAVIASTDAAAVFSILRSRGVRVKQRLASTLELESGSNDPAAVFLTVAMISYITEEDTNLLAIAGSFVLQMALGVALGYLLARVAVVGINRLNLDQQGLYPVLTFAFVLFTFEGVTYVGGSGFLAVYVAGVTMAHHDHLHRRSLARFHDAIAWLVQIAMFVLLGLLVFPSRLDDVVLDGLLIALLLMFVARPIAVWLTMLPMRVDVRETAFVSWVGLRGATPIILATFPVAAGVPDADVLFDVVFFVVLASVIVQGTTLPWVARRLALVDEGARPEPELSFDSVITGDEGPQLREITVSADAPAVGQQIVDLAIPQGVLVVLIRRGDLSFMPQGRTVIDAGDGLLVAAEPSHRHSVDALFVERRLDEVAEPVAGTPGGDAEAELASSAEGGRHYPRRMEDITVREQVLPGIGQRFEIDLDHERRIVVVAAREGNRTVGVARGDDDELEGACTLTPDQSMMVGALLLGARFSIDTAADPAIEGDRVAVELVAVPAGAPGIGRRPSEVVAALGGDVAVLGVIRDVTPDIVESDPDTPLTAGDRVAVAARSDLLDRARQLLGG